LSSNESALASLSQLATLTVTSSELLQRLSARLHPGDPFVSFFRSGANHRRELFSGQTAIYLRVS
jgi:hypothetical protein